MSSNSTSWIFGRNEVIAVCQASDMRSPLAELDEIFIDMKCSLALVAMDEMRMFWCIKIVDAIRSIDMEYCFQREQGLGSREDWGRLQNTPS